MDAYQLLTDLISSRERRGSLALPSVIGVGAPRAGTSWLSEAFARHPEAWVPPNKLYREMNYFGIEGYRMAPGRISLSEYSLFFEKGAGLPCRAEFTPVYLSHDLSLAHLCETLPGVKVVVQLRDRMSRLWSQFKHHQPQHGYSTFDQFISDGLRDWHPTRVRWSTEWFSPAKMLSHSLYAPGVEYLLANLGRGQILLLEYEQLEHDPQAYAAAAFRHAKISDSVEAPLMSINATANDGPPPLPQKLATAIDRLFSTDASLMESLAGSIMVLDDSNKGGSDLIREDPMRPSTDPASVPQL